MTIQRKINLAFISYRELAGKLKFYQIQTTNLSTNKFLCNVYTILTDTYEVFLSREKYECALYDS